MPANRPSRHQPTKHQPTKHEPGPTVGGGGGGPPVAKPQTTSYTTIDWQTLVRGIGQPPQVASYEFSNGRKFIQPGDREV